MGGAADRQDRIADLNPQWAAYAHELFSSGAEPRSNPDGDVELKNQSYAAFNLPECRKCGHQMLKPSVCVSIPHFGFRLHCY